MQGRYIFSASVYLFLLLCQSISFISLGQYFLAYRTSLHSFLIVTTFLSEFGLLGDIVGSVNKPH